ncbi:hypothetical protein PILCRDRAFT_94055 [Piloderma croceum F 1598]|uniref:Uncharacterized protein n=1 Tax=Piloderma croceum (strain F 1598) TaxID=765440 RepID=A0A0C3ET89_PILCF|nr:hypothetical protein PILCRDRAFT_94055 [Piloderma croceum F 1598]
MSPPYLSACWRRTSLIRSSFASCPPNATSSPDLKSDRHRRQTRHIQFRSRITKFPNLSNSSSGLGSTSWLLALVGGTLAQIVVGAKVDVEGPPLGWVLELEPDGHPCRSSSLCERIVATGNAGIDSVVRGVLGPKHPVTVLAVAAMLTVKDHVKEEKAKASGMRIRLYLAVISQYSNISTCATWRQTGEKKIEEIE